MKTALPPYLNSPVKNCQTICFYTAVVMSLFWLLVLGLILEDLERKNQQWMHAQASYIKLPAQKRCLQCGATWGLNGGKIKSGHEFCPNEICRWPWHEVIFPRVENPNKPSRSLRQWLKDLIWG